MAAELFYEIALGVNEYYPYPKKCWWSSTKTWRFTLSSFKTSPRRCIYVRLNKLSDQYGYPRLEEIKSFSRRYKKRLGEVLMSQAQLACDEVLEEISLYKERISSLETDLKAQLNLCDEICITFGESSTGKLIFVFMLLVFALQMLLNF